VTITFISSAIKDTAGNQLGQPGTWSFKIKGAPVQQSSGSGGGGGGGILSLPTPTPTSTSTPTPTPTTTPPTSTPSQPSPVTTPKPGATPVLFTRTLSRGMSGDDVRALQEFLAQDKEIYPEGLITGYFGPLTEKAVSKFQDRYGLKITGSVDFDTLNKIKEFISKSKPLQRIKIRLEGR
jgi:peptidoglycan hydrolase-like protein with peptidoglycan-binding domain